MVVSPLRDHGMLYGWTVETTIHFYIYVTRKKATDNNFTADGGKVYVVAKYSGDVHPAAENGDGGFSVTWFKYGFEDATSTQLLSPVKDLPNAGQEAKDGDVYTCIWSSQLFVYNSD